MIGLIGLTLVVAFSVYQFVSHGRATTGVPAGKRLRWFAAPLATTTCDGDANLHPPCTLADHDPRALNLCIDARRGPIVLSLFVPGVGAVRSARSTRCSRCRAGSGSVQFAAVAVDASHAATAGGPRASLDDPGRLRSRRRGRQRTGSSVCPMAELARRGGVVATG